MTTRPTATAKLDSGRHYTFRDGLPAAYDHQPTRTVNDALQIADAMVRSGGNYPHGMSPCFTAALNGDQTIPDHCIFDDEDHDCEYAESEGWIPRSECTQHSEAEHYPHGRN